MAKVVALFGGTFNPPHIGHLALANYVCECTEADELWFMVTPCNPFKAGGNLLDDRLRLKMVTAAVDGYARFKASDFEFHLPRPSYTVDTLAGLRRSFPDCRFVLLIGADNWLAFDKWRNPEEILAHHEVWVYGRPGLTVDAGSLPRGVRLLGAPLLEVSSTFIRESVARGRDVRYYTHPAVWEIIEKHELYR